MGPGQENSTMLTNDKETLWEIPKLAIDGSNWLCSKPNSCLPWPAETWMGTSVEVTPPFPPIPTYSTSGEAKWTTMDQDKNQAYLLLARKWKHDEHISWAQLAQVVSDTLLIRIQPVGTVAAVKNNTLCPIIPIQTSIHSHHLSHINCGTRI